MIKKFAVLALAATYLSACTTTDPYTGEQKVSNMAGGAGLARWPVRLAVWRSAAATRAATR